MLFLKNRSVPRNISQFHWYFEEPIKLSIFLLDYVLASTLAKLSIVSSMILRELMQWHFWKRAVLIFHVFFPYSSTWLKVQSPHKLRKKNYFQTQWHYSNTFSIRRQKRGWIEKKMERKVRGDICPIGCHHQHY